MIITNLYTDDIFYLENVIEWSIDVQWKSERVKTIWGTPQRTLED